MLLQKAAGHKVSKDMIYNWFFARLSAMWQYNNIIQMWFI